VPTEINSGWIWNAATGAWPSLQVVFLLSLRVATTFLMTPVLYAMPMPTVVRMLLVLSLSLTIALGIAAPVNMARVDTGALWSAAFAEVALGATLALGILLAFAAFDVAGRLLDIQIGFGIAQVFDPVSQRQIPVLTSMFSNLAVLLFFLVNGHHALLRGIAYSTERFPVGGAWSLSPAVAPVLKQVGGLFSLGFALAAPVVFCILLVELTLGVIARNLPQMNMFVLGIPVKIVVGLAALSLWFAGLGGVMTRVYDSIYVTWDGIFSTVPGTTPPLTPLPGQGRIHGR
jgi:flagellar biosynthesis protein FliR